MNDEEKAKESAENLNKEPENNMPEGLEVFEPGEATVRNINQQDDQQQFVAKDIGFSQNTEEKKNERYTGPVTQASYDTSEMSQSFNSSNTVIHKSHATRNKKLTFIILLLVIATVVGIGYFLSTTDTVPKASESNVGSNADIVEEQPEELDNSLQARKARDSERKTDINTLHQQVEAYFADNGFYPSDLSEEVLVSVDLDSLLDPTELYIDVLPPLTQTTKPDSLFAGGELGSLESPQYSYQAYNCTSTVEGSHCLGYTLSAWLETDPEPYEKQNIN